MNKHWHNLLIDEPERIRAKKGSTIRSKAHASLSEERKRGKRDIEMGDAFCCRGNFMLASSLITF